MISALVEPPPGQHLRHHVYFVQPTLATAIMQIAIQTKAFYWFKRFHGSHQRAAWWHFWNLLVSWVLVSLHYRTLTWSMVRSKAQGSHAITFLSPRWSKSLMPNNSFNVCDGSKALVQWNSIQAWVRLETINHVGPLPLILTTSTTTSDHNAMLTPAATGSENVSRH